MFRIFSFRARLLAHVRTQAEAITVLQSDSKTLRLALAEQAALTARQADVLHKTQHELRLAGRFLAEVATKQATTTAHQLQTAEVVLGIATQLGLRTGAAPAGKPALVVDNTAPLANRVHA